MAGVAFYTDVEYVVTDAHQLITLATIPPGTYGAHPIIYVAFVSIQAPTLAYTPEIAITTPSTPVLPTGGAVLFNANGFPAAFQFGSPNSPAQAANTRLVQADDPKSLIAGWAWQLTAFNVFIPGFGVTNVSLDGGATITLKPAQEDGTVQPAILGTGYLSGSIVADYLRTPLSGTIRSSGVSLIGTGTAFLTELDNISVLDSFDSGPVVIPGSTNQIMVGPVTLSATALTARYTATQTAGAFAGVSVTVRSGTTTTFGSSVLVSSTNFTALNTPTGNVFTITAGRFYWVVVNNTGGSAITVDAILLTYADLWGLVAPSTFGGVASNSHSIQIADLIDDTHATISGGSDPGITAGSTGTRLHNDPQVHGVGTSFVSELAPGSLLYQSPIASGVTAATVYTVASVIDDLTITLTDPVSGLPVYLIGTVAGSVTNTWNATNFNPPANRAIAMVMVLDTGDPNAVASSVALTNLQEPPLNKRTIPLTFVNAGNSAIQNPQFAVGVEAYYAHDASFTMPELVGGLSTWAAVGERQSGHLVLSTALWTNPGSRSIPVAANWTQPASDGGVAVIMAPASFLLNVISFRGRSFATIVGD